MTHKRNTAGLSHAAKLRREETIKRVNDAINLLIKKKETINFNSVSKMASVGKTWLYNEMDVRNRILDLRIKPNTNIKKNTRLEEKNLPSKSALINMLKNRNKELDAENRELKKQIEVLYGQLAKKG
jgi:hypothetical protein